jgi:chromosome segregation ATPase
MLRADGTVVQCRRGRGFFRDAPPSVCYNRRRTGIRLTDRLARDAAEDTPMKTFKFALGALLAAGLSAALPSTSHAQYPAGGNSALTEQRKAIKDAEGEVNRIRNEMNKMKTRVSAKYEGKEEWETAKTNLKTAETAYEKSRKAAMAKLYASPEYKAAKDKQLKAEQALAAQQAAGTKANDKAVEKAQQDRLDAGLALRKLETDALAADPKIAENKAKVAEAKKAWDALQDEVKEALKQDPEYLALEQQLTGAQEQVAQMKLSLQQAQASEAQSRRQQAESERQSRSGRSSSSSSGRSSPYGGGYGSSGRR